MGNAYYISKNVAMGLLVLAVAALITIVALSISYHKERNLRRSGTGTVGSTSTSMPPPSTTFFISKEPWDHFRLPDTLTPIFYNVTLWPRLEPNADGLYVFTGHSVVIFRCLSQTDLIIIHSSKLNLTTFYGLHAKLRGLDGITAPAIQQSWLVAKTEYLVLRLSSSLSEGRSYELYTEFQGELADDLHGFYRSEYVEDGVKKVVATSQMQATYARRAFPCFDEPAMKAVFNITIVHDRAKIALSNSKDSHVADAVIEGADVKVTTFEPTARMSTYLLAFIVCDFDSIDTTQNDLLIRIWARRKAIEEGQGNYALNVTGPILKFFEQYYDTQYPLSKSDQIALPDFHAGAMENWGLVTYRETALLYDPDKSVSKERVAVVISHELAHMWFGNLVTLRWWNETWLNEGFASYVEYLGADYAEPTWNFKDRVVLYDVHKVFAVDALASSHPLSRPAEEVNSPAEISEMFNTISYSKGAAVLRMLSEFLTESVFAKGLATYLKAFAFDNTVSTDLWDHLQQAADSTPGVSLPHTIHDIMNRWTLQMGFPVVTVDTRTGTVTQKHFLLDPNSVVAQPSQFNYTWFVPVKWMKSGVEQQQFWLLHKTDTHSPMTTSGQDWVLANTNVSGYFRVNYDPNNWDRLISLLDVNHQALPILNRAQLIDDAFNLARAEIVNTTLALRTTRFLVKEMEYIPWESALNNLNYYIFMFERSEVYGALQAYLKKQILPLFEHFKAITANWTKIPEGQTERYNQINAVGTACLVGVEECRALTKSWFRQWMKDPDHNMIQPHLKTTTYCNAIAFGGVKEWDFAWKMFKNTTVAPELSRLRKAMACTKTPWLLHRYLEYTLDPAKIRKQDALSTIQTVSRNVVGMPLAWNFIRENWGYLFQQYGTGSFSFPRLISAVTSRFCTNVELQELKKFKEENLQSGFGSATLALEQAIEKTTANIRWVTQNKAHMLQWFTAEST
ncbi:aminopeptidase N-like [Thalassophryne amazonica]|uniref:aminopeptidase N-like n=1 Tax=Thalassophryne amazonica TaxID=390379 RepID=UPI001470FBF4|nr:aminopeptidase N-like [Thalassophryne amazonica]